MRAGLPPAFFSERYMVWRTRESDGELVTSRFGCFLTVLTAPLWVPIFLTWRAIVFLALLPFLFFDSKADKELAKRREERFLHALGSSAEEFWGTEVSYREARIPKGDKGFRTLHIPSDDLKNLQRKVSRLIDKHHGERVHGCANAFIRGRGITSNARPHLGCTVLIKLDLKDFFPSVTRDMVKEWLWFRYLPLEQAGDDRNRLVERLMEITCLEQGLPQGAPSSPILSNLVMRQLDMKLSAYAKRHGACYTRYADDLTFSYRLEQKGTVRRTLDTVAQIVRDHGFELNRKKSKQKILRRHQHQSVCGVTLNSGKLTVSRRKRRQIRAAKHQLSSGKANLTAEQVSGWEAYIAMVDGA